MPGFRHEQQQNDGGDKMIEYWIWLSQIPYIGPVTANRLLQAFGTPEQIFHAANSEILNFCHLNERQVKMITENHSLDQSVRIIEKCKAKDIKILTINDNLYSRKAKKNDAPIVLYYKGNLKQMNHTVGIVGSRRCSRDVRQTAIKCAEKYSKHNVTVISGMAKGVDAYAHTSCIKSGGYTIAILANGLDICYPQEHNALMERIIENGAVLSEYPPGVMPSQYRFPWRNRLISAWSDEVVVIGAGKGSGAFITAEYAKKYGKVVNVFAVK